MCDVREIAFFAREGIGFGPISSSATTGIGWNYLWGGTQARPSIISVPVHTAEGAVVDRQRRAGPGRDATILCLNLESISNRNIEAFFAESNPPPKYMGDGFTNT